MSPHERHSARLDAVRTAVLDGDGATDRELRAAAAGTGPVPEPLGGYLAKIRDASYRITDRDVAELEAAGHGEEDIFEITVAAALGAALHRFEAGMRAVRS